MLLLAKEVSEDVVQSTRSARLPLAVFLSVAFGEVEGSNDGVVDERLEDDGHEARLAHVIESSQSCSSTRSCGGVVRDQPFGVAVL